MTTIATDGRIIAADGRVTSGGEILSESTPKLRQLADGSAVGWAGAQEDAEKAVEELAAAVREKRDPAAQDNDTFTLLRLFPYGMSAVYQQRMVPLYVEGPHAIGSGHGFARGAMLAGASALKAIRIAHKADNGTGPLYSHIKMRP